MKDIVKEIDLEHLRKVEKVKCDILQLTDDEDLLLQAIKGVEYAIIFRKNNLEKYVISHE